MSSAYDLYGPLLLWTSGSGLYDRVVCGLVTFVICPIKKPTNVFHVWVFICTVSQEKKHYITPAKNCVGSSFSKTPKLCMLKTAKINIMLFFATCGKSLDLKSCLSWYNRSLSV